jgi:hypothetical protein
VAVLQGPPSTCVVGHQSNDGGVVESENSTQQQEGGTGDVAEGGLLNTTPKECDADRGDGNEDEGVGQSDTTDPQPADAGGDTATEGGTRMSDPIVLGTNTPPVRGSAGVGAAEGVRVNPGTQRDDRNSG